MRSHKTDTPRATAIVADLYNIESQLQQLSAHRFIVLPLTSVAMDPAELANLITEVAASANEFIKLRNAKKLNALVELLTSDIGTPKTLFRQAQMIARARRHVLEGAGWLTAAQLSNLAGFSARNPSVQPNKWKSKKQIFAIQIKGVDYFPEYALNPHDNYRPLPIVREIMDVFAASKDGWGMAYWFVSINGYLDDRAPQDLLLTEPQLVLKAAQHALAGICHG